MMVEDDASTPLLRCRLLDRRWLSSSCEEYPPCSRSLSEEQLEERDELSVVESGGIDAVEDEGVYSDSTRRTMVVEREREEVV